MKRGEQVFILPNQSNLQSRQGQLRQDKTTMTIIPHIVLCTLHSFIFFEKKRTKVFYLNIMKCFLTNRTKTWRVIHYRLSGQKSSLFFSYHFLSCYNVEEFLIQLPTAISKGKVCIRVRWPVRAGIFSGFRGMKRLGEFLLPPVQHGSPSQG